MGAAHSYRTSADCALVLIFLSLCCLVGCGRQATGVEQRLYPPAGLTQLPGLSELETLSPAAPRTASDGVPAMVLADAYYLKSDNATPDTVAHSMILSSSVNNMSCAIYEFSGLSAADAPFRVEVDQQFTFAAVTRYYLGVSDYISGAWHWTCVAGEGETYAYVVPWAYQMMNVSGNAYVAVATIIDGGGAFGQATIKELRLSTAVAGDWSMDGRNARHDRCSPYVGAQTNHLQWAFETNESIATSPAIAADGTIYVADMGIGGAGTKGTVWAVNPDGTEKWHYTTGGFLQHSSPAIGPNGAVYIGCDDNKLYALNPDGSLWWSHEFPGSMQYSSPVIGGVGRIYICSLDHNLYSISLNSSVNWGFPLGEEVYSTPAIDAAGIIYLGFDHDVLAVTPSASQQWDNFDSQAAYYESPAISKSGLIYVSAILENTAKLVAFLPDDGSVVWTSDPLGVFPLTSPAIGPDGSLYAGSQDSCLYAITPSGALKWAFKTGDRILAAPAVGADGTVYFGSEDSFVYAVNADGTLKWSYETPWYVQASPAIGANGVVYIGGWHPRLYAFGP